MIINGRTDDRIAEAIERIQKTNPKARLHAFAGDLSDAAQVVELYKRFSKLDILVNNVGMYEPKPFEKITDADWHKIIEVNFFSGVRLSRAYLPVMLNHNWGPDHFHLERIGGADSEEMIHYGVTKTMQLALARGLAETTAGTGVTVNSVLPGRRLPRAWRASSRTWRRSRASRPSSGEGVLPDGAAELAAAALRDQ